MEHEKLLAATRDTRSVVNTIFDFLLKEVNDKDIYELSNPEKCRKYIVTMATTLDSIFYQIRLEPARSKEGFIFFRAAKDVLEPKTEAEKKQRYSLCVIISYFYARIFQIYGALALSVIDEAQTMRATRYSDIARGSILLPPGLDPYFKRGGAWPFDDRSRYDDDDYYRYSDRGRTPYRAPSRPGLGDFSFLDPYLDRSRYDQEMGYRLISSRDRGMTFRISSQQAALATATTGYLFVSSSSVKDRFIFVDMSARNVGSGRVKVTIGKAHIGRTGKTVALSADDIGTLTYTFHRDDNGEYYLEGDTTKYAGEVMAAIGNKVLEYVRGRDSDAAGYVRTDPVTGKEISGVGVMDELRLTKIITNLSRIKPLGYCVARALQLLSSDPLPDKSARSAICNPRFLESTDAKTGTKYMRSGIPLPGEGLDTNPGMLAMSLLFFDVVDAATPKIAASNEAVAEFKDFLIQMDGIIGMGSSGSSAATAPKKELTKLSDVKMRACGKAETDIIVPAGTVPEVMGYVRQLFAIQKEHTARVGAIMSQLFWIQRDRGTGQLKITIHPNIFAKGMPELNRINALAKGALVEYYKHCEFTYRQGVAVVQKPGSGAAAVPTGAAVAKEAAARAAPAAAKVAPAAPTATAKSVAPPAVPAAPILKGILRKPEQRKL